MSESHNQAVSRMRRSILRIASQAGEGHIPSALSILDILWVLYGQIMPLRRSEGIQDDRFILSKGHASLALYHVLAEAGLLNEHFLETFCRFDSVLGGHPDRTKVPGVEASTGSLGHGFPIAVGFALALKMQRSSGRVFVLIGDGEANEGTTWEAALLASHHKLNNLVCIIDFNHSTDRALRLDPLVAKMSAFQWETLCVDGHDALALSSALTARSDYPLAIIAETVKGKGVQEMENNPAWHHAFPSGDQLSALLNSTA